MNASPIRCLVTAGPTREFLDPVRFISNPSSGKMGFALAKAAREAGWHVDLVAGPVALSAPEGVRAHPVVSAEEMLAACLALFATCDLLIMTAAVCDMRPCQRHATKQKKDALELTVAFERTPDILKTLGQRRRPGQTLVGFAAETENIEAHARAKLEGKNLDWIVANRVGLPGSGFEADENSVTLLGRDGFRRALGPASKDELARGLIGWLAPTRP